MSEELIKIEIKKVLGPTQTGTAVLLGNEEKTFVMFIGYYEGSALIRELNGEEPARPFTHELLSYVLAGFNVEIKQIIISDIVNTTFYATLVLEQRVVDEHEEWVGKRNEVRIDARPSDCLVLACKEGKDLYCSRAVFDEVRDVTEVSEELGLGAGGLAADEEDDDDEDVGFFKSESLKEMWEQIDLGESGEGLPEEED